MSASLSGLELVLLVTLVAAIAQVVSGFGFAVVATPFLAALLGTTGGIQLAIIVTGVLSAVMGWRLRHALDLGLLRRLLPASLPGLAIGYLGYLALDPLAVRLAMGGLILLFVLMLLVEGILRRRAASPPLRAGLALDSLTGFVAGAATTLIAMPGPPALVYLLLIRLPKEPLRATLAAFFVPCYAVALAIHLGSGGIPGFIWLAAAAMLPVSAIGIWLGEWIAERITNARLRALAIALLVAAGLVALLPGLHMPALTIG